MRKTNYNQLVARKSPISQDDVSQKPFMPNKAVKEKWISTGEMLGKFKISASTLARLRKKKSIPYYKLGGTVLYPYHLIKTLMLTGALNIVKREP